MDDGRGEMNGSQAVAVNRRVDRLAAGGWAVVVLWSLLSVLMPPWVGRAHWREREGGRERWQFGGTFALSGTRAFLGGDRACVWSPPRASATFASGARVVPPWRDARGQYEIRVNLLRAWWVWQAGCAGIGLAWALMARVLGRNSARARGVAFGLAMGVVLAWVLPLLPWGANRAASHVAWALAAGLAYAAWLVHRAGGRRTRG
jgi:hypothetical protein